MQKKIITAVFLGLFLNMVASIGLEDVGLSLVSQNLLLRGVASQSVMEEIKTYYPVCFLEDIEYLKCRLVDSNRSSERRVYCDKINKLYFKVWHKEYVFTPFFLRAIKKDFYKDIAPLKCIVFDKQDVCRGYITYALDDYRQYDNYLQVLKGKITSLQYQNDAFKAFITSLQEKTLRTGLIYYDLTLANLVYDGERYFLIDLEPVLDVRSCRRNLLGFRDALVSNQPEYAAFVKKILSGAIRCETGRFTKRRFDSNSA
ncbi:MAG: hypothetical protein P4L31_06030 [Candidatus Babeliales bacterium]|nr:hypothetical protein [Candidatus Babeliales bacterium]